MTAQPASPTPIVAALHDLSCFGRCALTVILPTLSAMGLQAVPVPTALLSTHTGGFTDMHFRDLSDDMIAIADHFLSLRLHFDALYSAKSALWRTFLSASARQTRLFWSIP